MNWIYKLRLWSIKTFYPTSTLKIRIPNSIDCFDFESIDSVEDILNNLGLSKAVVYNNKLSVILIKR